MEGIQDVGVQAGRPAGGRARGEASRRRGTCLVADGNKARDAGVGELAGASWRRLAGRPSPTCPRPGDAATPPLSTTSPAGQQRPLHLVSVPSSSSHGQTEGRKTQKHDRCMVGTEDEQCINLEEQTRDWRMHGGCSMKWL